MTLVTVVTVGTVVKVMSSAKITQPLKKKKKKIIQPLFFNFIIFETSCTTYLPTYLYDSSECRDNRDSRKSSDNSE